MDWRRTGGSRHNGLGVEVNVAAMPIAAVNVIDSGTFPPCRYSASCPLRISSLVWELKSLAAISSLEGRSFRCLGLGNGPSLLETLWRRLAFLGF